jgi:cytoskeleton protein RodZ
MAAISETLRQARLRSGVDLDKLAAKTKIHPRYLEAIETGDFDKLPSGIFARMFIKQYADAVGLDGASFAEEYQRSSQFGSSPAQRTGTIAETRSSFQPSVPGFASGGEHGRSDRLTNLLSSLIWVVAAILVCAGAYYGLAHLQKPAASQAPAKESAVNVTPSPSKPAAPVAPPQASPSVTPPAPAPGTATTPAPAMAPATEGTPAPIQLALTATAPVWVTAIADGKNVVSEVLAPGSTKVITASKGARLTLGNAGGIDIVFNGKKLEPFGPSGQVRTVDFTSWGAQVVSRTPPLNPDPLR